MNYLNKAIFSSYGSKKKRKRPPEGMDQRIPKIKPNVIDDININIINVEHLPSEDLDIELLNEVFKLENEIQEKIKRINEIK